MTSGTRRRRAQYGCCVLVAMHWSGCAWGLVAETQEVVACDDNDYDDSTGWTCGNATEARAPRCCWFVDPTFSRADSATKRLKNSATARV